MPANRIIADRAEFIDALEMLRRGRVLVHADDAGDERCLIDGHVLYTAFKPLCDFALIDEVHPEADVGRMHCYRLTPRGRDFAERACESWKRLSLIERLAVRLTG